MQESDQPQGNRQIRLIQSSKIKMQNDSVKSKMDINKRCFIFGLQIIKLCDLLPNKRSYWIVTDQVIRSATSIGANLIEGKASSSRLEYKKFYEISLRSANETKYWLFMLKYMLPKPSSKLEELITEITEIANMLAKGVMTLKRK